MNLRHRFATVAATATMIGISLIGGAANAAPTASNTTAGRTAALSQTSPVRQVTTTAARPVAARAANGCTAASYGMVCGVVRGKKLYVSTAAVVRDKVLPEAICDYQGVFTVRNKAGKKIYQKFSGRHHGCTLGRAWFDFSVHRNFPNKSKITLSFYERNVHQGTVAFKIHR